MDPPVQLGTRCLEPRGSALVLVAAIGPTKTSIGANSPGAMWMPAVQIELERVYTQAPQLHSTVTSLAATLGVVTATLRGIQAGATCGPPVAPTILPVETHIKFTNPAIAPATSKAFS